MAFSSYKLILSTACFLVFVDTVQSNPTTGIPWNNRASINRGGAPPKTYDSVAYCEPYCDMYGYYVPGKWCVSQDSSVEVYCCGNENQRYCCADPGKDVGDYPPVSTCPNSSWWYYQWRVIVGLLCTLVVMLLLAACCYYCCGGTRIYGQSRAILPFRRHNRADDEIPVTEDMTFNPESPYAFQPPEYSLPKDPPKYADIVNGVDNRGFDNNDSNSSTLPDNSPSPNATTLLPPHEVAVENSAPVEEPQEIPPPMYEEIDSNAVPVESVSNSNATTCDNAEPVAVHSHNGPSAESNTVITGSSSSLTSHGNTQHCTDSLPGVEADPSPPPPYQESPTDRLSPDDSIENVNARQSNDERF